MSAAGGVKQNAPFAEEGGKREGKLGRGFLERNDARLVVREQLRIRAIIAKEREG